jgi:uncharacterized alkaline shock family protein YloU
VKDAVEMMTGLKVVEVNVKVDGVELGEFRDAKAAENKIR